MAKSPQNKFTTQDMRHEVRQQRTEHLAAHPEEWVELWRTQWGEPHYYTRLPGQQLRLSRDHNLDDPEQKVVALWLSDSYRFVDGGSGLVGVLYMDDKYYLYVFSMYFAMLDTAEVVIEPNHLVEVDRAVLEVSVSNCYYTKIPFEDDGPNRAVEDGNKIVCAWVKNAKGSCTTQEFRQLLGQMDQCRVMRLHSEFDYGWEWNGVERTMLRMMYNSLLQH
jgi:hypothetical protein